MANRSPAAPWDPERPDWPGNGMPIKRTRPPEGGGTRFVSSDTHWWDASQLYGRDERWARAVQADRGRLKTPDELIGGLGQLVDPGAILRPWPGRL